MKFKLTLVVASFLLWSGYAFGQISKDITVPIAATVNPNPLSVIVTWDNPDTSNILILRRTKGQTGTQWVQAYSQTKTKITGVVDNSVVAGQTYEYVIQRTVGTLNAYGYVHVAVGAAAVDTRGKVLVIVDSTTADALGVELVRMKNDMRGDGWIATPFKVGPSATVASVKNLIVQQYNADPTNVKAVFLIGRVPIPYSGSQAWDGHPEHAGAWPCDNYYADINGVWTDNTVNISTAGRPQTNNIPGDGKFDQNYVPTPTELQVGRLDFRRLTEGTFGATEIQLLRRYLDKNHKFRTKQYVPDTKAIIDDNFGYFGGEAFASSGFRNAYPIVGNENIVEADFFNDTDANSYLLGYGCGGGWYQGAGGVGSSTNFGTDSVNVVFSNLFGSYFGDWDFDTDPFMPSALASKGGILTCGWAGRPTFFLQSMASGETIGYAMKETQNANTNNGFYGSFGEGGSHIALLGDPTLRAFVVEPPTNLAVAQSCNKVNLNWTAPQDTNIIGYYVYRSTALEGPYTRVTPNWLTTNTYTENTPGADTFYYQVRALNIEYTAGGGIWVNNSIGPIKSVILTNATAPVLTTVGGTITCLQNSVTLNLSANQSIQGVSWTGPNGFASTLQTPNVSNAGSYNVTVTAQNGCTATNSAVVTQNTTAPNIPTAQVSNNGLLTCAVNSITISLGATNFDYTWTGPNGFDKTGSSITVVTPGVYTVVAKSQVNGCTSTSSVTITQNITAPTINIAPPGILTCNVQSLVVNASSTTPNNYNWTGPGNYISLVEDPTVTAPGNYKVTVTNPSNGCSATSSVTVQQDVNLPTASISGNTTLSCNFPNTTLTGSSSTLNASYAWTGPGGYTANIPVIVVSVSGNYILTVTGPNGCTSTSNALIVTDGTVPNAQASVSGTITCANSTVTLQGNSSSPNIQSYQWTGPNGYNSNLQNPVINAPGSYTLTVKATNGCVTLASVNVLEDKAPPVYTVDPFPELNCLVSCVNLKATPSTVTLAPSEICLAGDFQVVATGANGCTVTSVVTILEAAPITVQITPGIFGCVGPFNVTAVPAGGTPPYSYLWSNGATTATTQLPQQAPFSLSVIVSDAGGCSINTPNFTITTPQPILITTVVTNCSTPTSNNGAIAISVSGGLGTFNFLWSNGSANPGQTNLAPGTYTCTVTDLVTGCTATTTQVVSAPSGTLEIEGLNFLQLSPNPSTGISYLQLKLEKEMDIQVSVVDATGRLIWTNNAQQNTEANIKIDLSKVAPGVYNVLLRLDHQTLNRKLVLIDKP